MNIMSLPDWKQVIDTEFNNYKAGRQRMSGYLTNVINYFTGGGTANYPVAGQRVKPTDLTPAELLKYEIPDFDIRKFAFMVAIQSNMVESTRIPRDWAGVKGLIDAAKNEGKYGRSPPFDNYSAEEKAVWNNCQIPIIGTGTTSNPNNHPLYNRLCDIYNNPASKAFRDADNWEKYYGDFAVGGIGPANGFFAGDWDKNFFGMTATQLKGFQLPTDDARRLQIAMNREQYRTALTKSPAGLDKGTQDAYIGNIKALFDNNRFQFSPLLSPAEQTALATLPAPGEVAFAAAQEKPMGVGGGRRRRGKKSMRGGKRGTRKNKRTRRR